MNIIIHNNYKQTIKYYALFYSSATPGAILTGNRPVDLFSSQVKDPIYNETCRYAEQQIASIEPYLQQHCHAQGNEWVKHPMTRDEVDSLLSIIITMGVIGFPTLRR